MGGVVVDQVFSDFRYVDPFRRYLRSNSKVVSNRAEFWTFLMSVSRLYFVSIGLCHGYLIQNQYCVGRQLKQATFTKSVVFYMSMFLL